MVMMVEGVCDEFDNEFGLDGIGEMIFVGDESFIFLGFI